MDKNHKNQKPAEKTTNRSGESQNLSGKRNVPAGLDKKSGYNPK